ncbi:hypothetical protein Bbelb_380620 [Branchiostoma belcheri]|nr:hypothetical protein Bbelb_380620 [Branchiostoma belcheri]
MAFARVNVLLHQTHRMKEDNFWPDGVKCREWMSERKYKNKEQTRYKTPLTMAMDNKEHVLSVGCYNCRGITTAIPFITRLFQDTDIIAIAEHWLYPQAALAALDSLLRTHRVYFPDVTKPIEEYRHQVDLMREMYGKYETEGSVIFLGDFNADMGSNGGPRGIGFPSKLGKELSLITQELDLVSLNLSYLCKGPVETFQGNGDKQSTIDHILIPSSLLADTIGCEVSEHSNLNLSDHNPIIAYFANKQKEWEETSPEPRLNWDSLLSQTSENTYKRRVSEKLEVTNTLSEKSPESIDEELSQITTILKEAANETLPTKVIKSHQKPYWSTTLTEAHQKQVRSWLSWKEAGKPREKDNILYAEYKKNKSQFRAVLREAKVLHEAKENEELASMASSDDKKFWSRVKQRKGKKDKPQAVRVGDQLITDPAAAETLAEVKGTSARASKWRADWLQQYDYSVYGPGGKSQCIVFGQGNNKTRIVAEPNWVMGEAEIPEVCTVTHVGVQHSASMTSSAAIEKACKKGEGRISAIMSTGLEGHVPNPLVSKILYNTIVLPSMLHGCELWYPTQTGLMQLERVHRAGVKRMQGMHPRTGTIDSLGSLGMFTMRAIIDKHKLCFFGRLANLPLAEEYHLTEHLEKYWLTTEFPSKVEWKRIVKTAVRNKEERDWIAAHSDRTRLYRIHKTNTQPHKLWALARKHPKHMKTLQKLVHLSTVPVNHTPKLCPTCSSPTQDIVGHLVAQCSTFNNLRASLVDAATDRLGTTIMASVNQQPDERLTEIFLGVKIVEGEVDQNVWEDFMISIAGLMHPLATMAMKHTRDDLRTEKRPMLQGKELSPVLKAIITRHFNLSAGITNGKSAESVQMIESKEMAATIPGVACGKVDVDESDVDTMVGANADKLRGLIYRMTMVNDNMNASEQGRLVSSYHSTLRKTAYLCGTV